MCDGGGVFSVGWTFLSSQESRGLWIAGRYEILAKIGRGGFAVVYRARDPKLGREVAAKRLQGPAGI